MPCNGSGTLFNPGAKWHLSPCPGCENCGSNDAAREAGSRVLDAAPPSPERAEPERATDEAIRTLHDHDIQPASAPPQAEERETQAENWRDLPQGRFEGATRYATDDEEVLTLWRDGRTWDVREEGPTREQLGRALRDARRALTAAVTHPDIPDDLVPTLNLALRPARNLTHARFKR